MLDQKFLLLLLKFTVLTVCQNETSFIVPITNVPFTHLNPWNQHGKEFAPERRLTSQQFQENKHWDYIEPFVKPTRYVPVPNFDYRQGYQPNFKSNQFNYARNVPIQEMYSLASDLLRISAHPSTATNNKNNNRDMLGHQNLRQVQKHDSTVVNSVLVPNFRLDTFHTLDEIYWFLERVEKAVPSRVKMFTIGFTTEQRPIKAMTITNDNRNSSKYIWLDACTHAREWITVSTIIYIIEQALTTTNYQHNFILVPVVNPDGYVYTWTTNRLWRKNRRPYATEKDMPVTVESDKCFGVDLNRNYDVNFGGEGSSDNPCSNLYQGPRPFSEPETEAVAKAIWSFKDYIGLFVSLHSFNQLWSCPFAFTEERTMHLGNHIEVLKRVQKAIFQTTGAHYNIGQLSHRLYIGSGFSLDWVYSKVGIVHAYLAELRDTGDFGFVLPEEFIMPTATETWAGIEAAAQVIFGYR